MSFQLNDVYAIEGEIETDEQGYYASLQRAINAGMWSPPGLLRPGDDGRDRERSVHARAGSRRRLLGPQDSRPERGRERHQRQSRSFVADTMGEDWAAAMEAA